MSLRLIPGLFIILTSLLLSCAPAPTEPVLVDSFFSGQAFLDANGNGQLDSAETPLENATFIVAVQGGAEFAGTTDKTGNAFITIPSAVKYPVTLRMEAPKGSSLKLVGPLTINFPSSSGESTKFLFSTK